MKPGNIDRVGGADQSEPFMPTYLLSQARWRERQAACKARLEGVPTISETFRHKNEPCRPDANYGSTFPNLESNFSKGDPGGLLSNFFQRRNSDLKFFEKEMAWFKTALTRSAWRKFCKF